LVPIVLAVAACGGSDFSGIGGGGTDGGDSASSNDGSNPNNDSGGGSDVQPRDVVSPPTDAPVDAWNAPCPDTLGRYTITVVENGNDAGVGCGDFNFSAPQCIRKGPGACDIVFRSEVPQPQVPAINGDPTLQSDGSFSGGALTEGTGARTGCTGTWDATTSTMTVDCGGASSSQACIVALTRINVLCN
jgi:hypothetical protein